MIFKEQTSRTSRVVPGVEDTIAASLSMSLFNRVDLPCECKKITANKVNIDNIALHEKSSTHSDRRLAPQ